MSEQQHDYEQVARWLDGGNVELTADQQRLAAEVMDDQQTLAPMLDVNAPADLLKRLGNYRPARRPHPVRLVAWLSTAAAVAAVVLLSLTLMRPPVAPKGPVATTDQPAAAALEAGFDQTDLAQLDDLAVQIDQVANSQGTDISDLASLSADQSLEAYFGVTEPGGS